MSECEPKVASMLERFKQGKDDDACLHRSAQRRDHKKGSDWSERRKNPISLSKEGESEREEEREREIEDRELSSRRNVKEIMRRKRLRHQFRRLLSSSNLLMQPDRQRLLVDDGPSGFESSSQSAPS